MSGRWVRISPARRIVIDVMHFSRDNPSIPAQRRLALAPLVASRAAAEPNLPWPAIFCKAFALVARDMPVLRRVYMTVPWPHLHEMARSSCSVAIERMVDGERAVLTTLVKDPVELELTAIGRHIRTAAEAPLWSIKDFSRVLTIARLPRPLRRFIWWTGLSSGHQRYNYFGNFAISTVAGLGTDLTHIRSPFPVSLTYGVFAPDGDVDVRIVFDHRTLDGGEVARALNKLEETLLGPIRAEIDRLPRRAGGSPDAPSEESA